MCSALFVACSDDDNDGDVTAVVGLKSFLISLKIIPLGAERLYRS